MVKKLTGTLLSYQAILNGGQIVFEMSNLPINKK